MIPIQSHDGEYSLPSTRETLPRDKTRGQSDTIYYFITACGNTGITPISEHGKPAWSIVTYTAESTAPPHTIARAERRAPERRSSDSQKHVQMLGLVDNRVRILCSADFGQPGLSRHVHYRIWSRWVSTAVRA